MKILLIDTSSEYLYVYIYDNSLNKTIASRIMVTHNNHSENLLPALTSALDECNMVLNDIDEVVCGIGPGSYTGLRVGCVVGKMISYTLNKPIKTISSLLFCASNKLVSGKYLIKMKAKKDYSYYTLVNVNKGIIDIVLGNSYNSDAEVEKIIKAYPSIQVIDESLFDVNPLVVYNYSHKVNDIHSLSPNYLRSANQ